MKSDVQPVALEQHYTPPQLAKLWSVDPKIIREWFKNEPDVLIFGADETRFGKQYKSMRIPASVAERVHARKKV